MKKYLFIFLAILTFIGVASYQSSELARYKNLYYKELQNVKAYQLSNSGLEEDIIQYQMTIDNLRSSKDSIDRKLVEVIESLKIKDKNIEYLQYQTKVIHSTDTIQLSDTIFTPAVHIDTIIGDPWYNLRLKLDYPKTIIASPTFNSEQYVIINTKKEYVNKPSKLFFVRWFQRKYTVVEVNIEEKSPYIINKESKFIKMIK